MHDEATLKTDALSALGECVALPATGNGCSRLSARAGACGIASAECPLDREFTTADADCIAACAEQASCEALTAAAAGIEANFQLNEYTWCTQQCQCLEVRNCYKAE